MQALPHQWSLCQDYCVPQSMYYNNTLAIEWGQISCNKIHITKDQLVSVKNNRKYFRSLCQLLQTKITKNLIGEDKMNKTEESVVYGLQFCYQSTTGRIFNVVIFLQCRSVVRVYCAGETLFGSG